MNSVLTNLYARQPTNKPSPASCGVGAAISTESGITFAIDRIGSSSNLPSMLPDSRSDCDIGAIATSPFYSALDISSFANHSSTDVILVEDDSNPAKQDATSAVSGASLHSTIPALPAVEVINMYFLVILYGCRFLSAKGTGTFLALSWKDQAYKQLAVVEYL